MVGKRCLLEGAERSVPQDPRDTVKATLLESQSPATKGGVQGYSIYQPCQEDRMTQIWSSQPTNFWAMKNDFIQGDEWDTSVTLDTFNASRTRDHLPGASPMVTESP